MNRISVVVTTYRRNDFLREALTSVAQQTRPVFEVIVVDDGGDGSAAAVVESFGPNFRYIWQPNSGMQSARNRGIADAKGEWIAFLDDDDVWFPDRAQLVAPLLESGSVSVVTTNFVMFGENWCEAEGFFQRFDQHSRGFWQPGETQSGGCNVVDFTEGARLLPISPFWPSTLLARKSAIEEIGGWSLAMKGVRAEDMHFVFRLLRNSKVGIVWKPCLKYRVHAGNHAGTGLPVLLGRITTYEALLNDTQLGCTGAETSALEKARLQALGEAMWLAYVEKQFEHATTLGKRISWSYMTTDQRIRYVISRLRGRSQI